MSNPFETPNGDGPFSAGTVGDFDISKAFNDAVASFSRNAMPWIGGSLLYAVVATVSAAMCLLPALVAIPLLWYGWIRLSLDAHDGSAEVNALFKGFDRIGDLWLPMFTVLVMLWLIALPGAIAAGAVTLAFTGASMLESLTNPGNSPEDLAEIFQQGMGNQLASWLSTLVSIAWNSVVGFRFLPALFLVVEGNKSPMDAITESWDLTAGAWGKLIVLGAAVQLMVAIAQMMCCVPVLAAWPIAAAAQASAYRQLVGRG